MKKDETECKNQFCFFNSKQYYCKCKICDQKGSIAFLDVCRSKKQYEKFFGELANY